MGYYSELHLEKLETTAYYHTDRVLKAIELWYPIEHRKLTARLIWDILQEDYLNSEYNEGDPSSDIWDIRLEMDGSAVFLNDIELGEIYFKVNEDHSIKSHGYLSVSGDLVRDMYIGLLGSLISEDSYLYQWRLSLEK